MTDTGAGGDPRCLILIPAYNEADNIELVVRRALQHACVCVVDDGSTDDTAAIVGAIDGVHLIRHTQNTHIAGAVLDGMRYARDAGFTHCVTMDAGLSHDPDELPLLLGHADVDLVIGKRATIQGTPGYRRLLSRVGNTLINLGLRQRSRQARRYRLADTTSGFRMYSRSAFELLLVAPMKSRSFDFHLEALTYVVRAQLDIREVPITYRFSNSSLRWRVIGDALTTLSRLWREDFIVRSTSNNHAST